MSKRCLPESTVTGGHGFPQCVQSQWFQTQLVDQTVLGGGGRRWLVEVRFDVSGNWGVSLVCNNIHFIMTSFFFFFCLNVYSAFIIMPLYPGD